MSYPYSIKYVEIGPRQMPVIQLPQGLELVTTFLLSDVQGPLGRIFFLPEINRVLQSEVPSSEIGGNVCGLKIKKDFTQVIDMLADEGTENECVIETEELKNLIEIWCELGDRAALNGDQLKNQAKMNSRSQASM